MGGRAILWLWAIALLTIGSSAAATLQWNPNPDSENIDYYTVYAVSARGTITNRVDEGTSLPLDGLLRDVPYMLYVTATSGAGLESDRSVGLEFISALLPVITSDPAGANLAVGARLSLTVAATSSVPLTYQWKKEGEPLEGQTSKDLIISSVSLLDAGSYSVAVANQAGTNESKAARIVVQNPPTITTQPQGAVIIVGAPISLSVLAEGTDLQYQWFKENTAIPGQTGSSLIIPIASVLDFGRYHVTVSNLVGSISSALVTVSNQPIITEHTLTISQNESGGAVISARGTANATYDLEMTDNLQAPGWSTFETVNADATGYFEIILPATQGGSFFIRSVQR